MKKLLFILLALPCCSFAQQFEIGIDGGFDFHSLPLSNSIAKQDKSSLGYAAGVSIDLMLPNAQIGISVAATQLTETNYIAPNYTMKIRNAVGNPLTTPYGFYNHVWDQGTSYTYGGAMAGLAIASVGVNTLNYTGTNATGYSTAYNSAIGFVAGLQAGFVVRLNKKVGIGGEAAMRYTSYTYTPPNDPGDNPYKYRLFYFPLTVGLKYFIG